MVEPQRSTVRFDEASLGRFEPNTNPTRGKAREKSNRHPNGKVLLDNADAVIDALPAPCRKGFYKKNLSMTGCDAIMHHMKKATVRDLRYRFREVENLLREGEEIQITKRRRVIAKLMPCPPARPPRRPDFLERLQAVYGNTPLKVSGAELIARERGRS